MRVSDGNTSERHSQLTERTMRVSDGNTSERHSQLTERTMKVSDGNTSERHIQLTERGHNQINVNILQGLPTLRTVLKHQYRVNWVGLLSS